jgi:hypothetical protein
MTIKTRKPSGLPPWPIVLIAGAEKTGKSYACATASASQHIGRTFWIGCGEDDPDEYGAIAGARFEIVEHDGTYKAILDAITEASAEPFDQDRPNMIVIDSATSLWDMLCAEAQVTANDRAARKARRYNKPVPDDDVQITMDLWNKAKSRWAKIIAALKDHRGPALVTARLESVAVMENGAPTANKELKIKSEKNLAYEVGAIVQIPRFGDYQLTGVRSLQFKAKDPSKPTAYPGFTVEKLWTDMGLIGKGRTAARQYQGADGEQSVAAESAMTQAQYDRLVALIRQNQISPDEAWPMFSAWAGRGEGNPITALDAQITEGEAAVIIDRLSASTDPWAERTPEQGGEAAA